MYRTVKFVFVATLMAVPAVAQVREVPAEQPAVMEQQAPARPPSPMGTPAPQSGQRTPAAVAPAAVAEPARMTDTGTDRSDANIKLGVKVTDTAGGSTQSKTVMLLVANLSGGKVRSAGYNPNKGNPTLNVDATAELRRSGMVRVNLTIYYNPESNEEGGSRLTEVNESVSIFLKDGVPTVITQAADPTKGSRSVSIEVTASVVK